MLAQEPQQTALVIIISSAAYALTIYDQDWGSLADAASAFCAAGYRASGLAIALGNYHNAADEGAGVAPEHVVVDDYLAVVDLLVALTSRPLELDGDADAGWLDERAARAATALVPGGE